MAANFSELSIEVYNVIKDSGFIMTKMLYDTMPWAGYVNTRYENVKINDKHLGINAKIGRILQGDGNTDFVPYGDVKLYPVETIMRKMLIETTLSINELWEQYCQWLVDEKQKPEETNWGKWFVSVFIYNAKIEDIFFYIMYHAKYDNTIVIPPSGSQTAILPENRMDGFKTVIEQQASLGNFAPITLANYDEDTVVDALEEFVRASIIQQPQMTYKSKALQLIVSDEVAMWYNAKRSKSDRYADQTIGNDVFTYPIASKRVQITPSAMMRGSKKMMMQPVETKCLSLVFNLNTGLDYLRLIDAKKQKTDIEGYFGMLCTIDYLERFSASTNI